MSAAVLSVGSNVGDRMGHLRGCLAGLGAAVRAASPIYETVPWAGPGIAGEQDEFLNAVLLVDDPTADGIEWLRRAREREAAAERTRELRWGPRTLDVDLVTVVSERRADPELTLPHPRAHQRAFVLVPWLDVQPDAVLPGHGRVADLVAELPAVERAGVRRRDDLTWEAG